VLHTLVAGRSPLEGDATMARLLQDGGLALDPALPTDVADIVARATAATRETRWGDAGAMAAALGQSLARRVDYDVRTQVREWLALVRPEPAVRGKLDDLFAVDMVLSATGEVRQFTSHSLAVAPTVPSPPPRRRLWPVPVAVVVIAGAIVFWPKPSPAPAPAPVPVPVNVAVNVADSAPAPSPPPTDPPSGTGFVSIGGQGAIRAEILVEGRRRGYAPKLVELPAGTHTIELHTPDGRRLERTVDVTARHTPSAPVRWIVP
jgi:hypothetical protein